MSEHDPTAKLTFSHKLRLFRRNLEHRIRDELVSWLGKMVCPGGETTGESPSSNAKEPPSNVRRVLILRTGKAIGDAVMSLVLVSECRRLFPKARLDFLLRDQVSGLFAGRTEADL